MPALDSAPALIFVYGMLGSGYVTVMAILIAGAMGKI